MRCQKYIHVTDLKLKNRRLDVSMLKVCKSLNSASVDLKLHK